MSYTKTTWQNDQAPAINATNLNHIETGIFNNDSKIAETLSTLGLATDTWDSSASYNENDIVIYNDKLYKNITGDYTTTNPAEDTTNWMAISVLDYIAFLISNNSKNTLTTSTSNTYSCTYSNEHYGGVVLYENATGTDGEITLSDNYSNYSYIEVYYGWNADNTFPYGCMCTKVDLASISKVLISYNLGGSNWYINLYECWSLNNDNKLTRVERFQHNQSGYSTNTQTKITKVIGYK